MSLEEFENTSEQKSKRYVNLRTITDFVMGIIYIGVGVVILFARQFDFQNDFVMTTPAKIFAVLVIIYGSWRLYRGFRKDYFKKR